MEKRYRLCNTDAGRDFLPRFWGSVEDVLFGDLAGCEVYSYAPREGSGSGDDDPLEFLTRSMAGGSDDHVEDSIARGGGERKNVGSSVSFSLANGGRIVSDDLGFVHQVSPLSGGECPPHVTLWSMNYFFVSRNKKRIVLFACVETARTPQGNTEDFEDYDYGREEYSENNLVFDEARREKEKGENGDNENSEFFPPLPSVNEIGVTAGCNFEVAELCVSPTGDESGSVMVEETDMEEDEVDVEDADEDEVHVHTDFDTGRLSAPSQVA